MMPSLQTGRRVGIVGVGLMGHGIAANILAKGKENGGSLAFLVHPGNQPTDDLVAKGATSAQSLRELAQISDIIILCVTGSPEVEAVLTGEDGIISHLQPGMQVIDCSTSLPHRTRALAQRVEEAGGTFLDAPMTRTPREAAEGKLNLIVGGDASTLEAMRPLLSCFAESITHAGPVGSGHATKLLHNFVSLGFSVILAEAFSALNSMEGNGPDRATLLDILAKGGGAGVVLERMRPYITDGDTDAFRFSLSNTLKDMSYCLSMFEEQGHECQVARAMRNVLQTAQDAGHGSRTIPELLDLLPEILPAP